jgi:hypothetical protein
MSIEMNIQAPAFCMAQGAVQRGRKSCRPDRLACAPWSSLRVGRAARAGRGEAIVKRAPVA